LLDFTNSRSCVSPLSKFVINIEFPLCSCIWCIFYINISKKN